MKICLVAFHHAGTVEGELTLVVESPLNQYTAAPQSVWLNAGFA